MHFPSCQKETLISPMKTCHAFLILTHVLSTQNSYGGGNCSSVGIIYSLLEEMFILMTIFFIAWLDVKVTPLTTRVRRVTPLFTHDKIVSQTPVAVLVGRQPFLLAGRVFFYDGKCWTERVESAMLHSSTCKYKAGIWCSRECYDKALKFGQYCRRFYQDLV